MRIVRLPPRAGARRNRHTNRLHVYPPLEVGDVLQEDGGTGYRLTAEKLRYSLGNGKIEDKNPRVLTWEFRCLKCGEMAQTDRSEFFRPTARLCLTCKA